MAVKEASQFVLDSTLEYIHSNNLAYIAKDNCIYRHENPTGIMTTGTWVKYTPTQMLRILASMKGLTLNQAELIGLFQEAGAVYERTCNEAHEVKEGLFNLEVTQVYSIQEALINELMRRLGATGHQAFYYPEIKQVINATCLELGVKPMHRMYANWAVRELCTYHKLRLRRYSDRPWIPTDEEGYSVYKLRTTGKKMKQRSLVQRLDSPTKRHGKGVKLTIVHLDQEYLVKTVSSAVRHLVKDLPDIGTIAERTQMLKIYTDFREKSKL